MKRLPINLDDLAEAFDNSFDEFLYNLDIESGEVVMAAASS